MSKLRTIAMIGKDLPHLNKRERVVLSRIADCQTQRMGTNVLFCECGHRETHYNSCRDRHCPLCQGAARAKWVDDRLSELLPVSYFHVVFTVPHELLSFAWTNQRIFYKALFHSVHNTILEVCNHRENLGARVGGMSVLHTWNQKLDYHPHIHCIIPGGGISPDKTRWIAGNPKYLVPVKKLSKVFRGKLLSTLRKSCDKDLLFGDRKKHERSLYRAARKPWVVYAKRPFGSPAQVVKYLGRYTHRVGISEQRIVSVNKGKVCFSWLDRATGHKRKKMKLSYEEFIRRFLLHLLPRGMRKIRYFGYMSNRNRQKSIDQVKQLILISPEVYCKEQEPIHNVETDLPKDEENLGVIRNVCLKCGKTMSSLGLKEIVPPNPVWLKRGLARRRMIHGPEPDSIIAS